MFNKVMLYFILDIIGFYMEGVIWLCYYGICNFVFGFKFNILLEKYVDLGLLVLNLILKCVLKRDFF